MEIWKEIPFTSFYLEASNLGVIRHADTKKEVKVNSNSRGYKYISTYVNWKMKTVYVHRCVLAAHGIVEGYENLHIHHKDHNPSNNHLDNLVWCTPSENLIYSLNDGRLEYSKQKASENAKNQLEKGTHAFFNLTEEQQAKFI